MTLKPYFALTSLLHPVIRLEHLIYDKSTGAPVDCAQEIGILVHRLYDYLKILREMGAAVRFSRGRQTYYYTEGSHFHVSFLTELRKNENFHLEDVSMVIV